MADATRSRKRQGLNGRGMFAQPHRRRIDQSSSDGSTYPGAQSSVGGAKNTCSDITLAAKGEDWAERAGPGRL